MTMQSLIFFYNRPYYDKTGPPYKILKPIIICSSFKYKRHNVNMNYDAIITQKWGSFSYSSMQNYIFSFFFWMKKEDDSKKFAV